MENLKYQNVSTSSSTPGNQGISQSTKPEVIGHSSSLQNVSGFSHDLVGNLVGQHVHSNTFANTQREMQGSQPSQQVAFQPQQRQHLPHQFLKQKVQKSIHPSFMQPNIHYSHHDQQPQQILSQTTPLQSSQQLMLPTQQPRQLIAQQLNTALLQQNHQFGQQNILSEQQLQQSSFYLQNIPNSFQQPMNPQSNVSVVQQQQKIVGPQSDVLNMQMHQHSANMLQQPEANTAQKNVPWTSQSLQLHKIMSSQQKNNSLMESTPHRSQTSPALLQPQNVIDKQKQLVKSQRVLPEASSVPVESTTHIENRNAVDWYDQAYQKIHSMKEKILPDLFQEHRSTRFKCLQALEPGVVEKGKNIMSMLEKMIRFLQISRSDIVQYPKERVLHFQHAIFNYWTASCKSHGSVQNQGPQFQLHSNQSLTQLQQQRNMKLSLSPMNSISSNPAGTIPVLSMHPGVPNSQPNTTSSLQSSSQVRSEQRNTLNPFHQTFMKPTAQNVVNVLQAPSSSSINTLDNTMSSPQPSSAGATFPQMKQPQKHQMMQTQKLKPQIQQQWMHHRKQQMMQKMYEVSDGSVKTLISASSGMVQQHHSPSQSLDYSHQSLSASHHQFHATSPQTSQHSCPQMDQQNFLSPLSKSGTPLQSDASPFIPSPSTPLTPSSVPVDLDKHPSGVFPLSVAENNGHPQTSVAHGQVQIQNQALTMGTPGISASPLLSELTSPDGNEQSNIMEQPLDRLLKAVKSISPTALNSSVHEIGSVGSVIDRIARTGCNESRAAISSDLVANTRYHLQLQNLIGYPPTEKMERRITAVAFDDLSSSVSKIHNLKPLRGQISDIESTANSRFKRPRIEPCNVLLKEIRDINQHQVEIVVDIISDSAEDVGTTGAGEGVIVKCSYNAVCLRENFKSKCAGSEILSIFPLWFHVPANYPKSSPTVLDKLPFDWSWKEHENLSQKARLRFNLSLRHLSEPLSLAEMARTWEFSARSVFSEYAQLMGGKCFTSKYGTWENCVVAS